jgi:hypothetical protein
MADALQPSMVGSLLSIKGRQPQMTLSDVIISNKSAYTLDFDATSQSIMLDFRDSDFISSVTASDCSRLSTSALQTISMLDNYDNKSRLPWNLIQLYYSAFYAGHALVRLLGEGCCWLESTHVTHIGNLGAIIGKPPPFKIQAGSYKCAIEDGATRLSWTKVAGGSKGGSHEAFWNVFDERIRVVAENVLTGPMVRAESQLVFYKLNSLRELALRNGSVSWLSRTRNDLQYRLTHDVWYPSSIQKHRLSSLDRLASQWQNDPMTIDLDTASNLETIGEFSTACAFIISLCRTMLIRIHERNSGKSKSFISFGPIAFLNSSKMRSD